jgi:signal transduction histidine kinase
METYILTLIAGQSLILLVITIILFYSLHKISRLKRHEEVLINTQTRQRDFLPVLVHELRAPLSVIHGASDLLLNEVKNLSAEQISTLLSQIKNSSFSLLKMVGDILDVSKMDVGKFEVNRIYANLNTVLTEECSYFQSLAKVKNISLQVSLDSKVTNSSFDPERLKQVMNNLLSNALKYCTEGGKIVVVSKQYQNEVQVAVEDSGIGITDNEKPLLFNKFSQIEGRNHIKERGTGLGLYITKGIVEAHKGRIWVEDNKPKGSRFVFAIPLS